MESISADTLIYWRKYKDELQREWSKIIYGLSGKIKVFEYNNTRWRLSRYLNCSQDWRILIKLYKTYCKLDIMEIVFAVRNVWKSLPANMLHCHTTQTFRNVLFSHLLLLSRLPFSVVTVPLVNSF